jgi:hypothetical protein
MIKRRAKAAGLPREHRQPHLPSDRDHDVPAERRNAGACPGHRGPRVPTHDEALRPNPRRDHTGGGGTDRI